MRPLLCAALAICTSLAACSGALDPSGAAPGDPAHAAATPACTGRGPMTPGGTVHTMPFGKLTRSYYLYVPTGYDPTRAYPLVMAFHGFTDHDKDFVDGVGLPQEADQRGFILVAPQGSGLLPSWNAGSCCGEAQAEQVNDIGFSQALLASLEGTLCVDSRRVYAAGFSNGSFFVDRMACEMADKVAAVAAVSGPLLYAPCTPSRPISMLAFHGTADPVVGYNGNKLLGFPGAVADFNAWGERDACTGGTTVVQQQGQTTCEGYTKCGGGAVVTLCTVTGEQHAWPDGSLGIAGTPAILDFFGGISLP